MTTTVAGSDVGGGGGGSGSLRMSTTGSLESSIIEKQGVLRVGDRIRYNPYFNALSEVNQWKAT